tara:strand:- start:8154 stop:9182 length:1029 start_codon:yes stop_codon:yes gene_type:complete
MNVVIGAGIFGLCIALKLKKEGLDVVVLEKNKDIMQEASKCNHNRIHFGFHYPRSIETALQSLKGYKLFYSMFKNSIVSKFKNYYLIENNSNICSSDYETFCKKINVYYKKNSYPKVDMNFDNIENSFLTNEPIFDYIAIKTFLLKQIKSNNIEIIYDTYVNNIKQLQKYKNIINCSYANINKINNIFKLPLIKLKIQDVVIPIFELQQDKIGLTIMDGEFCSILPKGNEINTYLLYSVKHSVIRNIEDYYIPNEWIDGNIDIEKKIDTIYKESSKYYSFLKNCKRISYLRTFRVVPINTNDERLSSIYINKIKDKTIYTVLSGKITTSCLISEYIFDKIKI